MNSPLDNQSPNALSLRGVRSDLVIDAIRQRAMGADLLNGRKIGLVLEGGGMRGSTPAGGALALGHLGLADTFDDVYATSAAVMNASYFLTAQEDMGISVYFDDLTDRRFYKMSRLWKVLDIDYVINEVVLKRKPLNIRRLLDMKTRLHVSVMDRSNGEGFLVNLKQSEEDAVKVLHAALAIPVFYNRSVEINGRDCVDGGLVIPFPLRQAIADGCTDILVLLSHPEDYVPLPPKGWQKMMYRLLFSQLRKQAFEAFKNHYRVSLEYRDLALGRAACPDNVNIATLCPEELPYVQTLTMDRDRLMAAATHFGRRTLAALGAESDDWNLGPASAAKWTVTPNRPCELAP